MISGSGVWRKFWLGRFMISGSNVNVYWCMLHIGWHVIVQFVMQNIHSAILSVFLRVGVILLWYCLNSFSFIIVLLGSVICSNVVMFNNSIWWRYF